MNDMSSAIAPKSDQINADDLIGGEMTITINKVEIKGGQEQPVSIFFDGSEKAFRPCKSMSRVLVAAWGADAKAYVGRSLQLYRDPSVKWGGLEVGGIRIRAMTDIDAPMTMALTATKGSRKPFTVKPLVAGATKAAPAPDAEEDGVADDVSALVAQIKAAPDAEAAAAIMQKPTPARLYAWLPANRPELAAQIDEAIASKTGPAAVAAPVDEAVPPNDAGEAAAPVQEGPADEDRGEAHNGDDDAHPAREAADRLLASIRGAARESDLKRTPKEQADYDALPDDMRGEVDAAITEQRQKMGDK